MEIEQEIQHSYGIASSLLTIGELFMHQKDYPKAQEQFGKALQIAQKAGTKDLVKNAYYALFQHDSLQGNSTLALQNYQNYVRTKDEIYNAQKSQQMIQMQTIYETEKKEHQIQLKTQENIQLKILNIATFVVDLLLLLVLVLLYNRHKLKIKQHEISLEKEITANKHLQQKIDFNNRELSAVVLHISQKNKVLLEVCEKMEGLSLLQKTTSGKQRKSNRLFSVILG